jgi:two-component system, LuxR family, response regulator FixJ
MNSTGSQTAEVVCLVDDDASIRRSITRMLEFNGVRVCSFGEPEDFLAYLSANVVHLAILDIRMEPMTGFELRTRLYTRSPQTRVIFITAQEDETAELTAKQAGAYAFFMKPFDANEFLCTVHRALEHSQVDGDAYESQKD